MVVLDLSGRWPTRRFSSAMLCSAFELPGSLDGRSRRRKTKGTSLRPRQLRQCGLYEVQECSGKGQDTQAHAVTGGMIFV